MAVDGGAADAIIEFLAAHNLRLKHVTQTHTHPDHMRGHQALIDHTGATHLDSPALSKRNNLMLEAQEIEVHAAPGHTEDSVVFYAPRGGILPRYITFNSCSPQFMPITIRYALPCAVWHLYTGSLVFKIQKLA